MTATVYTFHAAANHEILATAVVGTLQDVAAKYAEKVPNASETTRHYIHNGRGVVAALLVRHNNVTEILRDDYMQFDAAARDVREAAGIANDPR